MFLIMSYGSRQEKRVFLHSYLKKETQLLELVLSYAEYLTPKNKRIV